jgi:hypothetical protein
LRFHGGKQIGFIGVIARESGRSSIPPAVVIEPKGRGVLDTPLSRGMTTVFALRAIACRPATAAPYSLQATKRGTKCQKY